MAPGLELQPETRNKPSVLIIGAPLAVGMRWPGVGRNAADSGSTASADLEIPWLSLTATMICPRPLVPGRLIELVQLLRVHERPQPRFKNDPSVGCGQLRSVAGDRLRHDGGVLTHAEQR